MKIISVLSILALLLLTLHGVPGSEGRHRRGKKKECRDPPRSALRRKLRFFNGYKESPFIRPLQKIRHQVKNATRHRNPCKAYSKSTDVHHRSSSPWNYRIDYDPKRFPDELAVAECLCKGCLIHGFEDFTMQSQPVTTKIQVLRSTGRCDWRGFFSYRFHWEDVPIACTCVRPEPAVNMQDSDVYEDYDEYEYD
ncbi:interleukin-25-like [Branchiostoma floridae x Branchiostoma belcheri]